MTDFDRASLDRILPSALGSPDWEDVMSRSSARQGRRRWPLVALAAVILAAGLLVTPAFGIGGRLLALIESAPTRPDVRAPVWSPGGGRIAFLSRGERSKEVYVVNADGSGQRLLTRDARFPAAPAWSPNGRQLVFKGGPYAVSGVYVVKADGSGQRRLARSGGASAWSPDGRTIAFFSDSKIYLMNADGSEHRQLTRKLWVWGAGRGSCVVARRAEARLLRQGRPLPDLLQPLRREQRRERTAEPDAEAVGRRRWFSWRSHVRSCLVA